MNILHLSDTTLSGSPVRIASLMNKHSEHPSKHIVWKRKIFNRVFHVDMVGEEMTRDELYYWVHEWADVIHYHNRWKRQEIFKLIPMPKNKVKGVIQIHSPREEEGHQEEVDSKLPLAIIAQYHVRQWPELRFIVPNVVDINVIKPLDKTYRQQPLVCYAPSSPNGRGWNNKSYNVVHPILNKLQLENILNYNRVVNKPFDECLMLKSTADIGIDEVSTGSYHLASLEYLSMGICTFGKIDNKTERVVKDLTGCKDLPWVQSSELTFKKDMIDVIKSGRYKKIGQLSRVWMEKYWNPRFLCKKYSDMYEAL